MKTTLLAQAAVCPSHAVPSRKSGHAFLPRVLSLAALALLAPAVARGEAIYTQEDNGATLVVDVDADGATLDAAEVTAGITKIVKRGAGKLTSADISSFTGDFDIEEGVWTCTAAGHFGATSTTAPAGTIDVRGGASIEYAGTAANPGTLSGKTVNLYGAAAAGARGTIWNSKSVQMGGTATSQGLGANMMLVLHDNATINGYARLSMSGTFDLGGHVLTLTNPSWGSHDFGGVITNGGSIVVASGTTFANDSRALTFAADCASNAFVQLNGGTLNLKQVVTPNGWTLKNNGGTITSNMNRQPTVTTAGYWNGPIELSGAAKIANYGASEASQWTKTTVFNVMDEISGSAGTLLVGPGWLNLHGPAANTYAGAVTVRGKSTNQAHQYPLPAGSGGIGAWSGASVFTNASSITFRDSARLEFMDETASSVGPVSFVGDTSTFAGDPGDDTQSITGGSSTSRPTIAGIVKTGTNALLVDSPVHVTGRTSISNGTLRIGLRSQAAGNGLEEKYIAQKSGQEWTQTSLDYPSFDPANPTAFTRLNVTDLGINAAGPEKALDMATFKAATFTSPKDGFWYHGYLWNRTDAPVTWRICSAMMYGTYVFVRGENPQSAWIQSNWGKFGAVREITLQPGANEIDIVAYRNKNDLAWRWAGNPSTEIKLPLSYCTDTSWDITDITAREVMTNKTLKAKFQPLSDGGSGTLFTTTASIGGAADTEDEPVFEDLEFLPGTTLDLNGNFGFYAKNLTGCPAVTNNAGFFGITNHWTIRASDFPKADASVRRPMVVDGKLAFPEGATFSVDDDDDIAVDAGGTVVATATEGIEGVPVCTGARPRWKLSVSGNDLLLGSSYKFTLLLFY